MFARAITASVLVQSSKRAFTPCGVDAHFASHVLRAVMAVTVLACVAGPSPRGFP
jgi:hypothetical protein